MFADESIAGSWQQLIARIDGRNALAGWAAVDDRLAGVREVRRDVLPAVAAGPEKGRADDVLGALVRVAAADGGDDPDALLLVVHLCSDWVVPLARQLADLSPGMVGLIVGELTCQIRAFDWRRRRRAVAACLKWDTRRAVLGEFLPGHERRRGWVERVVAPTNPVWEDTRLCPPVAHPADEADVDVADLLLWAVRRGADAADVTLLVRIEQTRDRCRGHWWDELGVPRRTLYRRRARALRALREASRGYLAEAA